MGRTDRLLASVMFSLGLTLSVSLLATSAQEPEEAIDLLVLNHQTCAVLADNFERLADAENLCEDMVLPESSGANTMQQYVHCKRAAYVDLDLNGYKDCPPPGALLNVEPADFLMVDHDANHAAQGSTVIVIAFVSGGAHVEFASTAGEFFGASATFICMSDFDTDCGAISDGVIAVPLHLDAGAPRGQASITVRQTKDEAVADLWITGVPASISFEVVQSKDWVLEQAPSCRYPADIQGAEAAVASGLGTPYRSAVVARAYDEDGTPTIGSAISWGTGFGPTFGLDIAVGDSVMVPLGGSDFGALQVVCGGTPAGPSSVYGRMSANNVGGIVEIDVVNQPPEGFDSDGDGCADVDELEADPAFGGGRDPSDYWDFFDVSADRAIDLSDALAVLGLFGRAPDDVEYDFTFDRYIPDESQFWRTARAVDFHVGIDLSDALASLQSFGAMCQP